MVSGADAGPTVRPGARAVSRERLAAGLAVTLAAAPAVLFAVLLGGPAAPASAAPLDDPHGVVLGDVSLWGV
ncbi:hypothetical protein ABT160_01300 [Streptomyces sp. NPDC001941]|uniref:hypothetical protein n=1 Tax=Streptomyces sp. NPDC001941 TaxID=3154659 RepID=UPI00332DAA5C